MQTYWFLKWHVNYCEIKPAWSIWKLHTLARVLRLTVYSAIVWDHAFVLNHAFVWNIAEFCILGFNYLNRFAGNVVAGTGRRKLTCTLSFKVVVLLAGASACPVLTSFELAAVCSPVSPVVANFLGLCAELHGVYCVFVYFECPLLLFFNFVFLNATNFSFSSLCRQKQG